MFVIIIDHVYLQPTYVSSDHQEKHIMFCDCIMSIRLSTVLFGILCVGNIHAMITAIMITYVYQLQSTQCFMKIFLTMDDKSRFNVLIQV